MLSDSSIPKPTRVKIVITDVETGKILSESETSRMILVYDQDDQEQSVLASLHTVGEAAYLVSLLNVLTQKLSFQFALTAFMTPNSPIPFFNFSNNKPL